MSIQPSSVSEDSASQPKNNITVSPFCKTIGKISSASFFILGIILIILGATGVIPLAAGLIPGLILTLSPLIMIFFACAVTMCLCGKNFSTLISDVLK